MAEETRNRISLTVPLDMIVALTMLSERTGLALTTQATVTLRQALSQTLKSVECLDRTRAVRASLSSGEWSNERAAVANLMDVQKIVRGDDNG